MNAALQSTIPMDPREGGPLHWFEYADAEFRVPIEFFGEHYPRTPKQQETWLLKMLRGYRANLFFLRLLSRKGLNLDFRLTEVKKTGWPDKSYTIGTMPLAQLFSLPNENPAEELAQMKAFLTWLDVQLKEQGDRGRDACIQWYRGGYGNRGLEAAGFAEDAKRDALDQALKEWRKEPWFEAWYQKNMEHLGRVRMGPHCWFALSDLSGDREHLRYMEEIRQGKNAHA